MKPTLIAALAMAGAIPAGAITLTLNEANADRVDFSIVWEDWPSPPITVDANLGDGSLNVTDGGAVITWTIVWAAGGVSEVIDIYLDYLGVGVGRGSRALADGYVDFYCTGDVQPLPETVFGARVVYLSQVAPTPVPETPESLRLLAVGLGAMYWMNRRSALRCVLGEFPVRRQYRQV